MGLKCSAAGCREGSTQAMEKCVHTGPEACHNDDTCDGCGADLWLSESCSVLLSFFVAGGCAVRPRLPV